MSASPGAYYLAETAVELVEAQIKANIATALAAVRALRTDNTVTTEVPREYFRYEQAHVYRAPAVFTIVQQIDIRNEIKQANHINALVEIIVAAVVEDRIESRVTLKSWRYQAALMECLHLAQLTTPDGACKLFVRVQNIQFSGVVDLKNERAQDAVFRKEVSLRLQVEHIENLE